MLILVVLNLVLVALAILLALASYGGATRAFRGQLELVVAFQQFRDQVDKCVTVLARASEQTDANVSELAQLIGTMADSSRSAYLNEILKHLPSDRLPQA